MAGALYAVPELELDFGDGTYLFKLGLVQLAELQTKCGAPLGEIISRILKGRYIAAAGDQPFGDIAFASFGVHDLHETVRLALIGGNQGRVNGQAVKVDPLRARELTETYVIARPLREQWDIAAAIILACVEGYAPKDADPPKKAPVAKRARSGSTSPRP